MRLIRFLFMVLILAAVIGSANAQTIMKQESRQQNKVYKGEMDPCLQMRYLLYLPDGYGENIEKKWPVLLFLHGSGERGDDLNRVKVHGPPKIVETKDLPFIIVSPQCPAGERWEPELLNELLDAILLWHRADADRIYLTGLSMGGYGTWELAMKHPDKFAAIAPICGGGDPARVEKIKHIPTWVFHGAKDLTVPLEKSEEMVDALKKAGSKVKFTVYPEAAHDSWTETYDNSELYDWFLIHKN
jgi:predicted peptidase